MSKGAARKSKRIAEVEERESKRPRLQTVFINMDAEDFVHPLIGPTDGDFIADISVVSNSTSDNQPIEILAPGEDRWSLEPVNVANAPSRKAVGMRTPEIQVRIGKRDMQLLILAFFNHTSDFRTVLPLMEDVCELVERKKEPNKNKLFRHNLSEFPKEDLKEAHARVQESLVTAASGAWYLQKGRSISFGPDGRPRVRVGKKIVQATVLFYYWMPQRCGIPTCNLRHKTVFDFSKTHPEFEPHKIDLSHLYHDPIDVNPARIIMEPSCWNLARERCRQNCSCEFLPPCFTNNPWLR